MVKVIRTGYGKTSEVELSTFSVLAVLKDSGVREAELIVNDPEDEDNCWDFEVQHSGKSTTILLLDPNGDEIRYTGPNAHYEGLR